MNRGSRWLGRACVVGVVLVATSSAAVAQQPPETTPPSPADEVVSVPSAEACSAGPALGAVLLLLGVLVPGMPAGLADMKEALDTACAVTPPRTEVTRCALDEQLAEPVAGQPPPANSTPVPAPLGDMVQVLGEVEESATGSNALEDALLEGADCEQQDLANLAESNPPVAPDDGAAAPPADAAGSPSVGGVPVARPSSAPLGQGAIALSPSAAPAAVPASGAEPAADLIEVVGFGAGPDGGLDPRSILVLALVLGANVVLVRRERQRIES